MIKYKEILSIIGYQIPSFAQFGLVILYLLAYILPTILKKSRLQSTHCKIGQQCESHKKQFVNSTATSMLTYILCGSMFFGSVLPAGKRAFDENNDIIHLQIGNSNTSIIARIEYNSFNSLAHKHQQVQQNKTRNKKPTGKIYIDYREIRILQALKLKSRTQNKQKVIK